MLVAFSNTPKTPPKKTSISSKRNARTFAAAEFDSKSMAEIILAHFFNSTTLTNERMFIKRVHTFTFHSFFSFLFPLSVLLLNCLFFVHLYFMSLLLWFDSKLGLIVIPFFVLFIIIIIVVIYFKVHFVFIS